MEWRMEGEWGRKRKIIEWKKNKHKKNKICFKSQG